MIPDQINIKKAVTISEENNKRPMTPKTKVLLLTCGFAVLVLLLMAGVGTTVFYKVCQHTVTFVTADGTETRTVLSTQAASMPQVTPPEGMAFTGWIDELGNAENRSTVYITRDTVFTAQYITALNTTDHIPYLFADADGLYWPHHELTRGDAAIALTTLLCGEVDADDNFPDVTEDMDCYEAVAQLKALGVVDGSRFYPDDGITLGELIHWLTAFYQPTEEKYDFSFLTAKEYGYQDFCTAASLGWIDPEADLDPDAALTRMEAAPIINHATGRCVNPEMTIKETGCLADCGPFDGNYLEFAEAAVEHTYTRSEDGTETWETSKAPKQLYSGYVIVQDKLRYADEDGLFVTGYNEEGFFFVEEGSYTSGSSELDDIVWELLKEITDDSMTREEKLRAAYNYVVKNFEYLARPHHDFNSTGWEVQEATWMFKNGKGNCYSFAAAFWALARGLGYDAIAQAGLCAPGTDHGWVIIEEDGIWYVYDPEIEHVEHINRWKLDRAHYCSWGYTPDPQLTYGTETSSNKDVYSSNYNYSPYDPNDLPDHASETVTPAPAAATGADAGTDSSAASEQPSTGTGGTSADSGAEGSADSSETSGDDSGSGTPPAEEAAADSQNTDAA